MSLLRYGAGSTVRLDLAEEQLIAECDAPRGTPIRDVAGAVRRALESPENFPPLAQTTVPGDHVVLVLGDDVPQAPAVIGVVVAELLAAGILAGNITLVRQHVSNGADRPNPLEAVDANFREQIRVIDHDPANRQQLSYLAASGEGKPVYLNRAILEADVVLPIGCLRLADTPGYHGTAAGVFPAFSDTKSIERYRCPTSVESPVQRKRLHKEADEVNWLLGILFTIQVVPGGGGDILHVLAGELKSVFSRGQALCKDAWSYRVPRRASLVVAAVEGDPSQQTWENVGRAISAAAGVVADDGAIAVCTDLTTGLGPALQQLAGADDLHMALRQITHDRPADAVPAAQLAHALERGQVYLLSRLEEAVVEELGVAPVTSADQIARLASRHPSCIVLANAQHAVAFAPDDEG